MRRGVLALLLCGAAGWGLWWAGHLPALRLSRVQVRGIKVLREAEVIAAARLRPGDSLIGPDLWRAARRLSRMPAIESAAVSRDLPSGVIIRVKERTPQAYMRARHGVIYIDADRMAFRGSGKPIAGVAEIAGISASEVRPGRRVEGQRIEVVLRALDSLREREFAVRRISVDGRGELKLTLAKGTLVWFGPSEDIASGADRLQQATRLIERRGEQATTIDLRDRDRIVWRVVEPG
jgi:cell division protein FtsQ